MGGEPYIFRVKVLFYSECKTKEEAHDQIRRLCLMLGDRFEGIVEEETEEI